MIYIIYIDFLKFKDIIFNYIIYNIYDIILYTIITCIVYNIVTYMQYYIIYYMYNVCSNFFLSW